MELWAPTGEASRLLGISTDTLKRWAKPSYPGQCLQEGLHFKRGRLPNSPLRWRVDLIDQLIQERSTPQRSSAPAAAVVITQ
jgi:hypothetical protein